jgi:S-formylglutathione hydrolase FrmB
VAIAMFALILVAVATLAAAPQTSTDPLAAARDDLVQAHAVLRDNYPVVNRRSGIAAQLVERLDEDTPGPGTTDRPSWMDPGDFIAWMNTLARLEKSLISQYATGDYHTLAAVRGADDTVFLSPVDHTMQPLAAYVPPGYDPHKSTSLVMFLHGRTCSENLAIALPWLQAAAASTNSIVVAPYARGDSQYVDPAPEEVYAALAVAEKAFNVDRRRVYLAGHSMGGYGVFIVAPKHPDTWAGVLAASGGMTTETMPAALRGLQGIPVYLVVGSDDPIVPEGYMRQNMDLLSKSGIETHYYEQPHGLHAMGSINEQFARAWRDMLARPRQSTPSHDVAAPQAPAAGLPGAVPTPTTRP